MLGIWLTWCLGNVQKTLMTWTMKSSLFQVPGWCFHGSWFTIPPYGWVACHPLQQIIKRWNWSRKKKKGEQFSGEDMKPTTIWEIMFWNLFRLHHGQANPSHSYLNVILMFSYIFQSYSFTWGSVSVWTHVSLTPPEASLSFDPNWPDPHGHGMTAGWLGRLGHTPNIWRIWHIHTS